MKLLRLSEIKVSTDHGRTLISLTQHPYYLAVKNNNQRLYNNFISQTSLKQQHKSTSTWIGIKQLLHQLSVNFDPNLSPIQVSRGICRHGRHRLCLLMILYPNACVYIHHHKIVKLVLT